MGGGKNGESRIDPGKGCVRYVWVEGLDVMHMEVG